jgi:hypothetical protein
MKQFYTLLIFMIFLTSGSKINAQTEWTGPLTTFTKADYADWTLASNQDQITSNVSITRANNKGIFNIVNDSIGGGNGYGPQPSDTEWAFGNISDGVDTLIFTTWGVAHSSFGDGNPSSLLNRDMVVHLITDDIYIDINFLSWSKSNRGGFSYERSTSPSLNINKFELTNKATLFPNPSSELIQISGLTTKVGYKIYNILGVESKNGTISDQEEIDIRSLPNGLYFLNLDSGNTLKFIKK